MDSGDDMLDPIGDYYSDGEEENEFGYLDTADQGLQPKTSSFTVLKEPDILRRQEDLISKVCAVLSVSRVAASILLRHHHWSVSELHEAWFADEERVRKAVGLPESPPPESSPGPKTPIDCGICFESFPGKSITSASCRHPYCKGCWRNYISTAIESGPGCLVIRCPEPSCQVAIGQDMIDSLTLVKDRMKYAGFLLRSFVEESRKIKWCPAAGCENAVELEVGDEGYDVTCECSNGFCWNCNEEAHRPVDCETVAKWMIKNSSEAENTNWILANSKPCPKCKRPIEKNHGCMHMTCRSPCTYQFCWLCLGDWSGHGVSSCNKYAEANKANPAYNEAERRRVMAKRSIEKYTHYYERWAANHSSKQKALGDLSELENAKLGEISNLLNIPETQLKFISEAWVQIIECRRVLKWSYAYGYYLPEEENAKKQFFEYSQGEAEAGLERLHKCAEKDLKEYLKGDREEDFSAFRTRLVGLTKVTGTYFENLVRALENGLQEVTAKAGCSKIAESKPTKRQRFK